MKHCCKQFQKEAENLQPPIGGGMLYPPSANPITQFEKIDGVWNVNGCCGGGCWVIENMLYCPFCGVKL